MGGLREPRWIIVVSCAPDGMIWKMPSEVRLRLEPESETEKHVSLGDDGDTEL